MGAKRAIIIGAGQAGAQGAASLRAAGFTGEVLLIGAETGLPYQRPPLSKAYLQGALARDRLVLKPEGFYAQNAIDLRPGLTVEAIDRAGQRISVRGGDALDYDVVLLATGAPPRRLPVPGATLAGVHYLRTVPDADALGAALQPGRRLVIIGAGYIGLEAAASARKAGMTVTVLEMAARSLSRVAGPEIAAFFTALHEAEGAAFRFGATVAALEGRDGRVSAAVLADGEAIACDAVLIGIGAAPALDLAADAGLAVADGIVVDAQARTSDPLIFAAGDVANFPSGLFGRRVRLESAPNAIDQAKVAAANIAGGDEVYDPCPWFWSDQYTIKLQTAGLGEGATSRVVRGDAARGAFSVWSFAGERLIAVDAVNDPAAFIMGKRLIAARAAPPAKLLADPGTNLKSLGF